MRIFLYILITLIVSACKENTVSNTQKGNLSLLKYGIAFEIMAPDDAQTRSISQGVQNNVSINNGKDYDVQVLMTDAISRDIEKLKAQKKLDLLSNPYFKKVVEEIDHGFIYEKQYEDEKGYDFYLVKIQGNHELSFQCGSSGIYTEKQVQNMVKSVLNGF